MPDRRGSRALLLLGAVLALSACPSPDQPTTPSNTHSYNLDSPAQTQVQEIPAPGSSVQITVNLGTTPHTLYLAFTNPGPTSTANKPQIATFDTGRGDAESPILDPGSALQEGGLRDLPNADRLPTPDESVPRPSPPRSLDLARGGAPVPPASSAYLPGSTKTFSYLTYTDQSAPSGSGTATLDVQVTNTTQNRIVNVWVLPGQSITTPMAQALADQFLAGTGTGADIYSWITGLFGREYYAPGTAVTGNLVAPTGEVDIVLADLNPNRANQTTYVYGYFYPANNFSSYKPGATELSNGRVSFFLDGPTFATADGGSWNLSDSHPSEIVSTLAHEFQHMINFYQKDLLQGLSGTDRWINEMASMEAEDLVAEKLGVAGPRGVPPVGGMADGSAGILGTNAKNDRLALFNGTYAAYSLMTWENTIEDYSMAFSFGSWLARNYGGPALFRNIVQNGRTDERSILEALSTVAGKSETIPSLLRHWAGAILASGSGLPEGYNLTNLTGSTEIAFPFSLANAVWPSTTEAFALGSINYFRYYAFDVSAGKPSKITGPVMASAFTNLTGIRPTGLYFLRAGSGLTGSHTYTLTLPSGVDVTLVAKVGP